MVHTSSRQVYKRKAPGQRTSPESISSLNRDSNAEYPENIPSQIVPSRSWESVSGRKGGYTWTQPPSTQLLQRYGDAFDF